MSVILGIDTSCYTTSVAVCCAAPGTADGLFVQQRQLLTVAPGQRGLMQSEAVFQHVTRLPKLFDALCEEQPDMKIVAVSASTQPRPAADSYMPVFRVGEGYARALATALRVPLFTTTHQQGHIRAALVDTALARDAAFLAIHLSGGTTELLSVQGDSLHCLGGTLDLHAGQLIDRVGVAMGLPFPSGPALEALAANGTARSRLPASIKGLDCHFSGAEAQAFRWMDKQTYSREDIAAEVFSCVARTVARLIQDGCEQTQVSSALLGGGVASSRLIRQEVATRIAKRNRTIQLHFARPDLAGDNAVGVSLIGKDAWIQARRTEHGSTAD